MHFKRVLLIILLTAITLASVVLGTNLPVHAVTPQVRVVLNGRDIEFPDQQPTIIQGRTLVPLRFIVEALGAAVEWHEETLTVVLRSEGQEILLRIGSRLVFYNGDLMQVDVPAQLVGGRTMVPLRFVSEVLGAQVDWDEPANSVLIFSKPKADPVPDVPEPPRALEAGQIFTRVSPAVVLLEILDVNDNLEGLGSGFIINPGGRIVTNFHVIEGAHSIRVTTSDSSIFWVQSIVIYDVNRDLAVLDIEASGLPTVDWGDSSEVKNGDKIFAIGNPLGLQNTISEGLVSSSSRVVVGQEYIQITAPISPGSSGGVLVNSFGQVIGVTTASFVVGQNLNLAIPINAVKETLERIDTNDSHNVTVDVASVSISSRSVELLVGSTLKLVATVSPAHATNAAVQWSSSDTSIVTVDATGLVTAISVGNAVVTVTTVEGGKQAACTIAVRPRSQTGPLHHNPHGNTTGNIGNGGEVAYADGWIYYSGFSGQGGIFRVRGDGSEKSLVVNHMGVSLNVLDGWIYFQNVRDNSRIYKVRFDGSDVTKLNDDESYDVTVAGDWIYYSNRSDDHRVYRIRTDGTERTRLNFERSVNVVVVDDWVYYLSNGLKRIRTDGSSRSLITSDQGRYINVIGEWIYYKNTSDGNRIYRIRTDGTGRAAIGKDSCDSLNVVGDWIYYQNTSDNNLMYKMLIDGTSRQRLTTVAAFKINVSGDWVYFRGGSLNGAMHRVGKDGTGQEYVM